MCSIHVLLSFLTCCGSFLSSLFHLVVHLNSTIVRDKKVFPFQNRKTSFGRIVLKITSLLLSFLSFLFFSFLSFLSFFSFLSFLSFFLFFLSFLSFLSFFIRTGATVRTSFFSRLRLLAFLVLGLARTLG